MAKNKLSVRKPQVVILQPNRFLIFFMMFILVLIPTFIGYIFITYVKSLEKKKDCKCSEDPRRKYLKFYGYLIIILTFINLIVGLFCSEIKWIKKYIALFTILTTYLASYLLYSYSDIIENNNCECADSWKRVFVKYYGYILIFLVAINFFVLTFSFIHHISTGEDTFVKLIKMGLTGRKCVL